MKMYYGNTPIKSMKIRHYEMDTNDATLVSSDMQCGITAYAKGRKVTGTGKSFEFANYGDFETNLSRYVPSDINIIEVSSTEHPIKLSFELAAMNNMDFSNAKNIATVTIDGNDFDISVSVNSNVLKISCDKTICLQVFYGKDNYV